MIPSLIHFAPSPEDGDLINTNNDEEYYKALNEIPKENNGIRKKALKEIEEEIKPLIGQKNIPVL